MKAFLALLATAALVASAAEAHQHGGSQYHSEMHHGAMHHEHADGNWHGIAPHKHDGKWMHRGHTHPKPMKKCKPVRWHDTKDLEKWRVKHQGKEICYSDKAPTFKWEAK